MQQKVNTPKLNVRALAEMLEMPAYKQQRILYEQKYPKQEPQVFRTPYYQRALHGIRGFYGAGNDDSALLIARNEVQNIANTSRRANNLRVLDAFAASSQRKRKLQPIANKRYSAMTGSVEIRLSPDLQALEKGDLRIIYFNCRAAAISEEVATLTVEIAHWVCTQNQVGAAVDQIEVIDLFSGKRYRKNGVRASTLKAVKGNAKIIEALWSTV